MNLLKLLHVFLALFQMTRKIQNGEPPRVQSDGQAVSNIVLAKACSARFVVTQAKSERKWPYAVHGTEVRSANSH